MWKQKPPKNTDKYRWTEHVQIKMHFYGLSEQKVLGVIRKPKRIETGIAEDTIAVMQPVGNVTKGTNGQEQWKQEIWVLYKLKVQSEKLKLKSVNLKIQKLREKINLSRQLVIISAWRYPGMAPDRDPLPGEIKRELAEIL